MSRSPSWIAVLALVAALAMAGIALIMVAWTGR